MIAATLILSALMLASSVSASSVVSSSSSSSADVKVQFYMLQKKEWDKVGMEPTFKSVVASGITSYCASHLTACGLTAITDYNFTSSDVSFSAGYPKDPNVRYMDLYISISYTIAAGRSVNLTAADVKAIVDMQRTAMYNSIGYYVVYIGSEFYSIPPPNLVNWIVVSLLIVITTAMVIVTCVLSHRHAATHMIDPDSVKPMPVATTDDQPPNDNSAHPNAPSSRQATAKVRAVSQNHSASPTAAVLLPGATNEGYNQSASERELRQRRGAEELVLTDATEFGVTGGEAVA